MAVRQNAQAARHKDGRDDWRIVPTIVYRKNTGKSGSFHKASPYPTIFKELKK